MKEIGDTLRAARAVQMSARRERAHSKSLRAWLRAQWLIGRKVQKTCRELRARVEADQLIARLRASKRPEVTVAPTPGSPATRYETPPDDGMMGKA